MSDRKKIIVYGLGSQYELFKDYIGCKFDIIGYSDSKKNIIGGGYIAPADIPKYKYDYICITSSKYFYEIKDKILGIIGKDKERQIISLYDAFGEFKNSENRDIWVIDKLAKIPNGKTLLDAGAGTQRYKTYCNHLKYISQDFGKYNPNEMDVGIQDYAYWNYRGLNITCDVIDMPLDNESVDVILCTEVFEHLKNPILAIKEFSRILKMGGLLILTAPFCCLTHMAPYFYYNGFSEYWYKEHLSEYGFAIEEFVQNGNFFKYLCQELLRVASMAGRYCNSQLRPEEISMILKNVDMLMKLSEQDKGSSETLCFGNMLLAEKIK